MFIYCSVGKKIQATKCYRRPKFKAAFGRAWQWDQMSLDGGMIQFVYDASFGTRWYFQYGGQWYWVRMLEGKYAWGIPSWKDVFFLQPPSNLSKGDK